MEREKISLIERVKGLTNELEKVKDN